MMLIRKFSLAYDTLEDRVACDAEDTQGVTTRLWLTQRLCRALVDAFLPIVEAAAPKVTPEHQATVQSFEQAAALADLGKTAGPRPAPPSANGLVRAVRIHPLEARVEVKFEFGDNQAMALGSTHPGLRQILFVLRRIYGVAGWPLDFWPAWISEPGASPPADAVN
jgi:hypothetical protein